MFVCVHMCEREREGNGMCLLCGDAVLCNEDMKGGNVK